MGRVLGIDFGEAKLGLAVSSGSLAVPLAVLRYEDIKMLADKIGRVVWEYEVEKIVVGLSEGKSAKKASDFGNKLAGKLGLPVYFVDETLSSSDAQALAIEAGITRSKRKKMEDAFAAALILQKYLDSR